MLVEDSCNVNLLNLKLCQDVQHRYMVIAQQRLKQHAPHVVVAVGIVVMIPILLIHPQPLRTLVPTQALEADSLEPARRDGLEVDLLFSIRLMKLGHLHLFGKM